VIIIIIFLLLLFDYIKKFSILAREISDFRGSVNISQELTPKDQNENV
jgi:hypothetical protein